VEGLMTRKGRVPDQRGGLPAVSHGDKNYKMVDYQKGFFVGGGLIVGSTNPLPPIKVSESPQQKKGSTKLKTYKEKSRAQEFLDEASDVANLF
jgi:hypothetical protein